MAYTEGMSDSNKKFPNGADFYYQSRHRYYKDWYWYLPESLKYLIVAISILTIPLFVSFIGSGFDRGEYISLIFFIGLCLWSGVTGTNDAWWMPERVTDHFKYDSRITDDGVNRDSTNVLSDGIAQFLFVIVASPINAAQWIGLIFCFTGPFVIGAFLGGKLMLDTTFVWLFLLAASWLYMLGYSHINDKNEELRTSIVNGINGRQSSADNIREDDESRNVQYDIIQLCKKQLALETSMYCLSIVSIELLILNFL